MTEREVETVERKDEIVSGKTFLGIEFGSTRIKAVLTDANHTPIASGSHEWENRLDHGIWTYTMDDIWGGLQDCYRDLKKDVKEQYGVTLTKIRAIGFSAMMHGYLAFDKAAQQQDDAKSTFHVDIPLQYLLPSLALIALLIAWHLWQRHERRRRQSGSTKVASGDSDSADIEPDGDLPPQPDSTNNQSHSSRRKGPGRHVRPA